jgi:MoaA/NifB/PqqE/SkfB family radical SAM enzyme
MATLFQKAGLLRGLLGGEAARTGPFFVDLDVTRRCNLNCLGCHYHSRVVNADAPSTDEIKDVSLDSVRRLCEELKKINTNLVVLGGSGEPLLHPGLLDIVSTIKSSGLEAFLITNGTLLNEEIITALIRERLDVLRVSLWAGSPEQYKLNYPGTDPDNFHKLIAMLELAARLKAEQKSRLPKVMVHQPLNRNNFNEMDSMVDLASRTGSNGLTFSPMNNASGALKHFELTADDEMSVRRSLVSVKKRLNSLRLNHNVNQTLQRYRIGPEVWRKTPCYSPWYHARIWVDGTVQPCGRFDYPLGNINEKTFDEIWNGPAFRSFRKKALTSKGLASLCGRRDCYYCCFAGHNANIHRIFRWFSPFTSANRKSTENFIVR